jgi:hypothetical protein
VNNIYQKLVLIFGFSLVSIAIVIAYMQPTTGYELDIYSNTPILTWIFIFLAMLCGTGIIIHQIVSRGFRTSQVWLLGLLILVISSFSFLYIPYIRNYFTWNGDNISHWGMLKDIVNTGHFSKLNFYPITHSILSQIILITNAPIKLTANLSTAFLSALFIVSTYLLSTVILVKREQQLIATTIAAIVLIEGGYHVFLMPNGWSIFLLPLFFYFYFKNQSDRSYFIPFVILLIMYPFFHPLSSLMIAIILIVISFIRVAVKSFPNRGGNLSFFEKPISSLVFGAVELAILIPWLLSFQGFQANIKGMWENITSAGSQVLEEMGGDLSKINIQGLDLIILYIKLYGADTILIILTLISLILIIRQIQKGDQNSFLFFITNIGLIFIIFCLIYILYLAGMLGLSNIAGERIISYIVTFTPELAAIAIFWISQKLKNNILYYFLIITLLAIPSGLSLRGLYYSPYVFQPNIQVTVKDMAGFEWMITKKDSKIGSMFITNPSARFFDVILGSAVANNRGDNYDIQFSDHFGYKKYNTLGAQYLEDKYTSVTESDKIVYSTVWKAVGRFYDSDFITLEEDNTVSKLYSNGGTEVYYIKHI